MISSKGPGNVSFVGYNPTNNTSFINYTIDQVVNDEVDNSIPFFGIKVDILDKL